MPSFKPKSNKKIKFNKKSAITLDTKHKEFLHEFSRDEDNIIDLKDELRELKNKLLSDISVEERLEINDHISELKNKINEIKMKKKEYFLDNSKYIFEYFENKNFSFIETELLSNKVQAIEKLNSLLSEKVSKRCSSCGVKLADSFQFNICETCFSQRRRRPGRGFESKERRGRKDQKNTTQSSSKPGLAQPGGGKKTFKRRPKKNKAAAFKRG